MASGDVSIDSADISVSITDDPPTDSDGALSLTGAAAAVVAGAKRPSKPPMHPLPFSAPSHRKKKTLPSASVPPPSALTYQHESVDDGTVAPVPTPERSRRPRA